MTRIRAEQLGLMTALLIFLCLIGETHVRAQDPVNRPSRDQTFSNNKINWSHQTTCGSNCKIQQAGDAVYRNNNGL